MPSDLIVRCAPISHIREHPNADNLVILDILGWQVITNKTTNPREGELRVFIPPDAVLTDELVDQLDVGTYVKKGNVVRVRKRQKMTRTVLFSCVLIAVNMN